MIKLITLCLFHFIGGDKIICSSWALPVLCTDVEGNYFEGHHSYLLPVWLLMLYTKDILRSILQFVGGYLARSICSVC
jgi:hypothetical protein